MKVLYLKLGTMPIESELVLEGTSMVIFEVWGVLDFMVDLR